MAVIDGSYHRSAIRPMQAFLKIRLRESCQERDFEESLCPGRFVSFSFIRDFSCHLLILDQGL